MNNVASVNNIFGKPGIGLLKLKLITSGLYVSQSLSADISDHSLAGWIDLILPGGIWVRAPFKVNAGANKLHTGSIVLQKDKSGYAIAYEDFLVPVEIPERSSFSRLFTSTGKSMSSIGTAYAGYLALAPTSACPEWGHLLQCRYCAYGLDSSLSVDVPSVRDVVETVGAALTDRQIKNVHLYFGYYETEDGGAAFYAPYIEAIKKKYDVLISVQATPPDNVKWIDYLYALGVDSIAYNIEVYNTGHLKRISPQSSSLINRQKYLTALKHAVKIFPGGAVTSELLVGLEPTESTKEGIDSLISMGVLPTLAIIHPAEDCGRHIDLPTAEELLPLFEHLSRSIKQGGRDRRWVDHFNLLMDIAPETFLYSNKYGSMLAKKFGPTLSKMRRVIRVKEANNGTK